jgi:hypothetical protein
MDLELKVEKDKSGRKINLTDEKNVNNYSAYSFNGVAGILSLTGIIDGNKIISHYEKDVKENVWKKIGSTHFGTLTLGEKVYNLGSFEYQAFELLNKET